MYNVIALMVFVLGMSLIPFLHYIVNLPENVSNIYLYYIIMVANTALTYLYVYKTTLLSADQKSYVISKYDTVIQLIMFVFQCVVLYTTKSFLLYLLINVFCTILGNILKIRETDKMYSYLKDKPKDLSQKEKKNIFTNVKSLFLYRLGGVIQSNTDNILISIFVGTITVGYYSNYSIIIVTITTFITLLFTSLKASVGNYVNTQGLEEQYKMYNILEVYNFWIVSFCTICFMQLIPPFIIIFFGEEYLLANSVLIWICLNFYTSNIRQTLWTYRETTGMYNNSVKYVTLVTAIINIVLSIILGKLYGLIGILSATVISRMLYAWWREPMLIFNNYFKRKSTDYFIKYIFRIAYLFIIIFIINFAVGIIQLNNVYIQFLFQIMATSVISMILLIIPYIKSDAMKYVKKIVKR